LLAVLVVVPPLICGGILARGMLRLRAVLSERSKAWLCVGACLLVLVWLSFAGSIFVLFPVDEIGFNASDGDWIVWACEKVLLVYAILGVGLLACLLATRWFVRSEALRRRVVWACVVLVVLAAIPPAICGVSFARSRSWL
jgi:hypothetical protein